MTGGSSTGSQPPGTAVTITYSGPTAPTAPPRASRPLPVAILAVIMAGYGLAAIVVGGLAFRHVSYGVLTGLVNWVPNLASYSGAVGAAITLVLGIVILVTAVGLWRLKMLWLVIALAGVFYEIGIFAYAREFTAAPFLIALVLLVYLFAVSGHFT